MLRGYYQYSDNVIVLANIEKSKQLHNIVVLELVGQEPKLKLTKLNPSDKDENLTLKLIIKDYSDLDIFDALEEKY